MYKKSGKLCFQPLKQWKEKTPPGHELPGCSRQLTVLLLRSWQEAGEPCSHVVIAQMMWQGSEAGEMEKRLAARRKLQAFRWSPGGNFFGEGLEEG